MNKKHHCNNCPHWYVTKKGYPSGFYNITFCKKYNEQIYYLVGEENQTPHPCNMCEKQGSYVSYINQEVLEVKRVTERLTEDFYDDMQKITRHCVKSDNIDLNCGADDFQYVIDRLAEYEIAEKEGRLVVLPCKPRDVVYVIMHRYTKCSKYGQVFEEYSCSGCEERECDSHLEYYIWENKYTTLEWIIGSLKRFGKTVFLNREEAEKVLKEMNKNIEPN